MSERYVRPTIAGWLLPTLVAPWLSVYAAVTAYAALGVDWGLFGKVAGWALGMVVATAWTFVYCAVLVAVDLLLLAVRVRTLPTGGKGWLAALASPLVAFASYAVAPPHTFWRNGAWGVALAVALPMLAAAFVFRVVLGRKPLR